MRAEVAFGAEDFLAACDEWMAFGPGDAVNAPHSCFLAGLGAKPFLERLDAAMARPSDPAGRSRRAPQRSVRDVSAKAP